MSKHHVGGGRSRGGSSPKAVTDKVAHQGNPVTECSPSMRLIAAPTGPSEDGPVTCSTTPWSTTTSVGQGSGDSGDKFTTSSPALLFEASCRLLANRICRSVCNFLYSRFLHEARLVSRRDWPCVVNTRISIKRQSCPKRYLAAGASMNFHTDVLCIWALCQHAASLSE